MTSSRQPKERNQVWEWSLIRSIWQINFKIYNLRKWRSQSSRHMFIIWNMKCYLQVSYYFQLAQQHQQQLQQNSGSPTQAQQVCFNFLFFWILKFFLLKQPQSQPQPQQQAQVVQSGASGFQFLQSPSKPVDKALLLILSLCSGGVQTITVNQQQPQVIQLQPQQQQQPQPQQQAQAQQQMQPGAAAGPPGGVTFSQKLYGIKLLSRRLYSCFFPTDWAPYHAWWFLTSFCSQGFRLYSRSSLPLGRSTRFLYSWMPNSYR